MDEKELQMDEQELLEEDLQEYDLDAIIKEFSEQGNAPVSEESDPEAPETRASAFSRVSFSWEDSRSAVPFCQSTLVISLR